jgi:hypothetical protein
MGRPKHYNEELTVRLAPDGSSRLQVDSDRRAVVQFVLDEGGVATIATINKRFGYDMASTVKALVHSGWFAIGDGKAK